MASSILYLSSFVSLISILLTQQNHPCHLPAILTPSHNPLTFTLTLNISSTYLY